MHKKHWSHLTKMPTIAFSSNSIYYGTLSVLHDSNHGLLATMPVLALLIKGINESFIMRVKGTGYKFWMLKLSQ